MDNRTNVIFRIDHYSSLFLICLLISFLCSCAPIAKKDGPPNFYVDETKIPNAVPKPEPLAKYGNKTTYWVFGKPYHTMSMRNSKHYEAVGTASWYGTKFHKRLTSSGERYDMLAMTAAHKTLPLPTYVEVTNLRNDRTIIVKVNDRGPFEGNRLIDLSYVAAKKLGMLGHGTARVKIKALDPYQYNEPLLFASRSPRQETTTWPSKSDEPLMSEKRHPPFRNENFRTANFRTTNFSNENTFNHVKPTRLVYLQVGAFRSKTNALRLRNRLVPLLEAPVKIYTKNSLYHVNIGPINNLDVADKISFQLKNLGMKANKIHRA